MVVFIFVVVFIYIDMIKYKNKLDDADLLLGAFTMQKTGVALFVC